MGNHTTLRQHHGKGGVTLPTGNFKPITPELEAQLAAIDAIPDDQIDLSDIPEKLDWSNARVGMFYKPIKRQLTVRFDADLIEWFRNHGGDQRGYQTRMNRVLREYMLSHAPE